jgi:hypothetical protein
LRDAHSSLAPAFRGTVVRGVARAREANYDDVCAHARVILGERAGILSENETVCG